jgi:hypothetical protein
MDIVLSRLERDQIGVLLEQLLGAPVAAPTADWVLAMSDGNSYAVVELARAMQLGTTTVPTTLTGLALGRLRGISSDARTLVELLVAARRPLSEDTLTTNSSPLR